jgi:predicted Fe-Mo cluster-binding NifX family protein
VRIAISTDGNIVSAHFGRCPAFTIADISNGKTTNKKILDNPGHQPGHIPQFLHGQGVECIICGGMGRRAISFFSQYGIQTVVGVTGTIEEVIQKLEQGTLEGGPSLCQPGAGKGYGLDKIECDHEENETHKHDK